MCFTNDGDWCAETCRQTEGEQPGPAKCCECGRQIAPGEWRRRIQAWEYAECQICEDEFSDDWTVDANPCEGEHDYGETSDDSTCRECCYMLEAIEAVEREEGCPEHSRQPMCGDLYDAIHEDARSGGRYVLRAVEMRPEMLGVAWIRDAFEIAKGGA